MEERGLYMQLVEAGQSLDFFGTDARAAWHGAAEAQHALRLCRARPGDHRRAGRCRPARAAGEIQAPTLIGYGERAIPAPTPRRPLHAEILRSELWLVLRVGHFWPVTGCGPRHFRRAGARLDHPQRVSAPATPPNPAQVRRWLTQHVLLGLLQLVCAIAALFSVVLAGTTDLSQVNVVTWLLVAAFVVVSAVRFGLFFARGRPSWSWLEQEEN